MKQLSDTDIEQMGRQEFVPDDTTATRRDVRAQLKLGQLIPPVATPAPDVVRIDLHHNTEEQAWARIIAAAQSGARRAIIITGASGILHQKFPQWMDESIISDRILSWAPINNGSFDVRFYRKKSDK